MNAQNPKVFGNAITDDIHAIDTFSQWALFHTSSFIFRLSAMQFPYWIKKVASGDIALFSIIAASGPLKKLPGIMSTYRKHTGGISESMNVKNNINKHRIELMNYLNEFHDYKYDLKAKEIILIHQAELNDVPKAGSKIKLSNWINKLTKYYGSK
jgi:hypothetical protein